MSRHREHSRKEQAGGSEEQQEGGAPSSMDQARAAKLQQARAVRGQLKAQAGKAAKAISQGADLFLTAVINMGEEDLKKTLELDAAERIKDVLVDKIADKFKDGIKEVTDVGKGVASGVSSVFSAAKEQISAHIKAQSELSVLETAKAINAAMLEKASILEKQICEAIDALPREKILEIGKVLGAFDGIEDDADSAENGRLEDGMKEWAMTDLIGLPAGDGVAVEEYGRAAFASFQEGVRSTMTAGEAGDAVQKRLSNPNQDRDAIERAEESTGPAFKAGIERDKGMRKRVAATGGAE